MTYVGVSDSEGVSTYLAVSTDLKKWKRLGLIFREQNKDAVLFPEKIKGEYVAFNRPESLFTMSNPSIWISYSKDLIYWGKGKNLMRTRVGGWDEARMGAGSVPIKTKEGWLCIYHGVFETMDGAVYRLGVALHDLGNPAKIIGIADEWVLAPEDPWEITGYVHNVVFTCGAVEDDDGDVKIYWGGADTVMCAGTARVDDLVDLCLDNSRPRY